MYNTTTNENAGNTGKIPVITPGGAKDSPGCENYLNKFQRLRLMPPTPRLAGDLGLGG